MLDEIKGFGVTLRRLFRPKLTIQYPDERRYLATRFRGLPVLRVNPETGQTLCVACCLCERICPPDAIRLFMSGDDSDRAGDRTVVNYHLRVSRCMFCGLCAQVCPTDAIAMSHEFELATQDRDGLLKVEGELAQMGELVNPWPIGGPQLR
jgi:NADH-quinone oxidoreductase chain I